MGRRRYDGMQADVPTFRNVEPHVMQTRDESVGMFNTQFDLTKTLPFIEEYNQKNNLDKRQRLTFFQVFLCAMTRTFLYHPHLNRFILGRRYWQRNRLIFSFVVKKQLKTYAKETFAKIDFDPLSTIEDIRQKYHNFINRSRSDKGNESEAEIDFFGSLPRGVLMVAMKLVKFLDFFGILPPKMMIEPDPLYASVILANLGSVGIQGQVIHHIFEWGNASWFIAVNKIHKQVVATEEGEIKVIDVVDIGITLDERISEGMYYMKGLKSIKKFVENPELLVNPPDVTQDQIDDLMLNDPRDKKNYKKRQRYLEKRQKDKKKEKKRKAKERQKKG